MHEAPSSLFAAVHNDWLRARVEAKVDSGRFVKVKPYAEATSMRMVRSSSGVRSCGLSNDSLAEPATNRIARPLGNKIQDQSVDDVTNHVRRLFSRMRPSAPARPNRCARLTSVSMQPSWFLPQGPSACPQTDDHKSQIRTPHENKKNPYPFVCHSFDYTKRSRLGNPALPFVRATS